jgi:hypothetical protein
VVAALVGHAETTTRQLLDPLMLPFMGERFIIIKLVWLIPESETRYEKHAVSHCCWRSHGASCGSGAAEYRRRVSRDSH